MKKGPLVIYKEDGGLVQSLRNLPGVDTCHISALSTLKLAPGGHMGRFIIWTSSAFACLDSMFGGVNVVSEKMQRGRP